MEFENQHTLTLMALLATWTAVQYRAEKLLSLDKLTGRKGTAQSNGPMTQQEMMANLSYIHEQAVTLEKKKKQKKRKKKNK